MEVRQAQHTPEPSPQTVSALLEQIDAYIVTQGEIFGFAYASFIHPDILDLEIKEVIQHVRIKLWHKLQDRHAIIHHKAYIKTMIRNAFIDEIRKEKYFLPLLTDEYGEIDDTFVAKYNSYTLDPEATFEQQTTADELLNKVVEAIAHLPERQKVAIIYQLRERVDDLVQFDNVLRAHEIDVSTIMWPHSPADMHLLKASISPARKKILQYLQTACITQ